MIDTQLIVNLITAIIAVIAAIKAIMEAMKNKQVVTFYTEPKAEVKPTVVASLPARSHTMDEGTRRWVKAGESPSDCASIDRQIDEAEKAGLRTYYIDTSKGWYIIEYGLVKGGGQGEKVALSE